jgi:hypothetical protein
VSVPAATAAARARTGAAPAPLRLPQAPRRVSGPTRHPRAAVAAPSTAERRILALVDHPWLDRLIRGRVWIGLVAAALLGIVAVQVALLRIGAQIGNETATVNALIAGNQNAQTTIGSLEAGGGVLAQTSTKDMVDPQPGQDTYLRPSARDVRLALDRMHTPTVAAAAAARAVHLVAPPATHTTTQAPSTGASGATGITGATGATTGATGATAASGATTTAGSTAAVGSTTTTTAGSTAAVGSTTTTGATSTVGSTSALGATGATAPTTTTTTTTNTPPPSAGQGGGVVAPTG